MLKPKGNSGKNIHSVLSYPTLPILGHYLRMNIKRIVEGQRYDARVLENRGQRVKTRRSLRFCFPFCFPTQKSLARRRRFVSVY